MQQPECSSFRPWSTYVYDKSSLNTAHATSPDKVELTFNATIKDDCVSKTFTEAMQCSDAPLWRDSTDAEIQVPLNNGTWELVQLPPGERAIIRGCPVSHSCQLELCSTLLFGLELRSASISELCSALKLELHSTFTSRVTADAKQLAYIYPGSVRGLHSAGSVCIE